MFQVEPILWLQSLESTGLTWLLTAVTTLGYTPVYAIMLTILVFGFRIKEGLFVFLTMIIAGISIDGLKRGIMFPRPTDVDQRVIQPGAQRPPLLVDGGGANGFWTFPQAEALAAVKTQRDWSYGFPSGHVAAATAFLLSLAYFFRSRGVFLFSLGWIVLMALSRMYLGRHFIADVLGGLVVGVMSVWLAIFLVRSLKAQDSSNSIKALLPLTIVAISLVLLAPFVEIIDKENTGRLLALLITYALLMRIGFPQDEGKAWKRVARVLLAFLLYMALIWLINPILEGAGITDKDLMMLLAACFVGVVSFMGTVFLARRFKLYETA